MSVRRLLSILVATIALVVPLAAPVEAQPPPGTEMGSSDWRSVSAGEHHTCGIRTTGRLYCWGLDDFGQLGNSGGGNQLTPGEVDLGAFSDWVSVSAGAWHTCGQRASGRIYCWGRDTWGQLGDGGTSTDAQYPVVVSGGRTDWRTVVAGYSHTCAIRTSGRLFCWGYDGQGMLGDGAPNADQQAPVQVVGNHADWTQVSPGGQSTCGRRASGRLYCWGDDAEGQLGDGAGLGDKPEPVPVSGNRTDWRSVSVGAYHACAVRTTNQAFCWGDDDSFALGDDGVPADSPTPVAVVGVSGVRTVSAGAGFSCVRRTGGRFVCWGRNDYGQVGAGTFGLPAASPVDVAGVATDWTLLDVGSFHACGRTRSARLHCWGINASGQLGTLLTGGVMPWPVPVAA